MWSLTETFRFRLYEESRELDSAALVEIYEKSGGTKWTNQSNWISTGSIDIWMGVTVDATTGRVTELNLNNNNLTGVLTKEFGYITELKNSDLSSNQLTDTVPNTLLNLINLQSLDLADNNFNGLPNLATISTLTILKLDSNAFDFGDIEPLVGISNLTYSDQDKLLQGYDSAVMTTQAIDLVLNTSGANNKYQWFKDNIAISGANSAIYPIPSLGECLM